MRAEDSLGIESQGDTLKIMNGWWQFSSRHSRSKNEHNKSNWNLHLINILNLATVECFVQRLTLTFITVYSPIELDEAERSNDVLTSI